MGALGSTLAILIQILVNNLSELINRKVIWQYYRYPTDKHHELCTHLRYLTNKPNYSIHG